MRYLLALTIVLTFLLGCGSPAFAQDPATLSLDLELTYWRTIRDTDDVGGYELYLKKFPNGYFRELAVDRLAALKKASTDEEVTRATADDEVGASARSWAEFFDQHRTEISIGVMEIVRQAQSRIQVFQFAGAPTGTMIDFGLSIREKSPVITINVSSDTTSLESGETALTCPELLNLVRYLIADGGSTYYAQRIRDRSVDLTSVNREVANAACNNVMSDLYTALDRDSFTQLSELEARTDLCRESVVIEAGVGSSSAPETIQRCRTGLATSD
jgi:hypothetical protein